MAARSGLQWRSSTVNTGLDRKCGTKNIQRDGPKSTLGEFNLIRKSARSCRYLRILISGMQIESVCLTVVKVFVENWILRAS